MLLPLIPKLFETFKSAPCDLITRRENTERRPTFVNRGFFEVFLAEVDPGDVVVEWVADGGEDGGDAGVCGEVGALIGAKRASEQSDSEARREGG